MANTHFEQFLVAYARSEYEKCLDLYDKHHEEFGRINIDIVQDILTIIDIKTDLCP